mgnify:CR=1 FL=1
MPFYARMSSSSEEVISDVITYGRIVCVFSFGLFLESIWTKILQSNGNMKTPMFAQILGAVTNIIPDPLLIFGLFGLPEMGIAGAAVATVAGQIVAALVVMKRGFRKTPPIRLYPHHIVGIFRLGIPNILMQSAYTFYILRLNLILATFCDQAVTALGLYYKWQTFFFIPLGAMKTCMVPIISYNYAARNIGRCRKTLSVSVLFGLALMALRDAVLSHSSDADAAGLYKGLTGHRNRQDRFPLCRYQFLAGGHLADIPGVFPGGWFQSEKLCADRHPDSCPVCAARIFILPVRAQLVLDDISRHEGPDEHCGCCVLPAISEKDRVDRAEGTTARELLIPLREILGCMGGYSHRPNRGQCRRNARL